MAANEIHEGDIGTIFELTVKDDDVIIDVSTATTKEIHFKNPDGGTVVQSAGFKIPGGDGTDGIITYVSEADDLTPTGLWNIQAFVVFADGSQFSSCVSEFRVHANII